MIKSHGWIESGPDDRGRHFFVLFWPGHFGMRAQQFHAHTKNYENVKWYSTEQEAQQAARIQLQLKPASIPDEAPAEQE